MTSPLKKVQLLPIKSQILPRRKVELFGTRLTNDINGWVEIGRIVMVLPTNNKKETIPIQE